VAAQSHPAAVGRSRCDRDIVFLWLLDGSFGSSMRCCGKLAGLPRSRWFAHDDTALAAVIVPTVWKAYPFFTLTLLAALQAVRPACTKRPGSTVQRRGSGFVHHLAGIPHRRRCGDPEHALAARIRHHLSHQPAAARSRDRDASVRIYQEAFSFFRMGTGSALGLC